MSATSATGSTSPEGSAAAYAGENFRLLPGMQVIAEIHFGDRTVLEYLAVAGAEGGGGGGPGEMIVDVNRRT